MRSITEEDVKFLQSLQNEMLTQDTVGQADPRFWVVRGTVREYNIEEGFEDGEELVNVDGEILAENMKELFEYITNDTDLEKEYDITYYKENEIIEMVNKDIFDKYTYYISSISEFVKEFGHEMDVHLIRYKEEDKIFENTMFLTIRECEEHIKLNYYHYPKDAHSYAMTAWRSPQIEKLYKILQEVDWNNVKTQVSEAPLA